MSERTFTWPVRVYYEDTDIGGVVYYANYLKFMERARTEWFRSAGFEQDTLIERHNLLFVVIHADITYRQPARFNDLLYVHSSIDQTMRASARFVQKIHRDSTDGELLCTGLIRAACLHADSFRPRSIPTEILENIT